MFTTRPADLKRLWPRWPRPPPTDIHSCMDFAMHFYLFSRIFIISHFGSYLPLKFGFCGNSIRHRQLLRSRVWQLLPFWLTFLLRYFFALWNIVVLFFVVVVAIPVWRCIYTIVWIKSVCCCLINLCLK